MRQTALLHLSARASLMPAHRVPIPKPVRAAAELGGAVPSWLRTPTDGTLMRDNRGRLAQVERQVGEDVHGRKHFEDRQFGDRRQSVGEQAERRRSGPRALPGRCRSREYSTISQMRGVPSTCGMTFSRKFGGFHRGFHRLQIGLLVLVAHRADGDREPGRNAGCRAGCRSRPSGWAWRVSSGKPHNSRPPAIGGWSLEEHAMGVAALAALEGHQE